MTNKRTYDKYVGKNAFVGTITYGYVGKVTNVEVELITLVDVSRIRDTGTFGEFMTKGIPLESEPFPDGLEVDLVIHNVVDIVPWNNPLLRKVLPKNNTPTVTKKEILTMTNKRTYDKYVGKNAMVTTLTYMYVGKVTNVDNEFITLVDVSRIYDTGTFGEFVIKGIPLESEPYPDALEVDIALQNLIDVSIWNNPLLRKAY